MNSFKVEPTPVGKAIILVMNPFTEFTAVAGSNLQAWYFSEGLVCFKKRKLLISLTNLKPWVSAQATSCLTELPSK